MQPKTILITGGTSGIGREAALLLASQDHTVFAASRKPPQEPLSGVTYLPLDVRSDESVRACVDAVLAQARLGAAGQIDVLVNNAGYVGPVGACEEVSLDNTRALFETNFFGAVQMVNAVLPSMRRHRSGLIINVTSAAGRLGQPLFTSFYIASKHALDGYSEALSSELHPLGIRVAVVEPGYFRTNIHATSNLPSNPISDYDQEREHATTLNGFCIRYGRNPQQVAEQIAKLVNSTPRRLRYPVGTDIRYMLLVRSLLPEKIFERYVRWLLLGGELLKHSEDDQTLRRKLGFRRLMLENPLTDRIMISALIALGVAVAGGSEKFLCGRSLRLQSRRRADGDDYRLVYRPRDFETQAKIRRTNSFMTSELIHLPVGGHRLAAICLNPGASGEPVILLHGITSSLYAWAVQPPCVLAQGPCYSLSLPGHFPANFPADLQPEALTAEMIARVLSAAIRELVGDRPVTLIGHSTGGFAALAVAASTPALARRVVSVSGFAQGRWTGALGLYQKLVRSGAPGRAVYKAIYKLAGLAPALLKAAMRIYVADARAFYAYPDLPDMMRNAYPAFKQLDLNAMMHYFYRMPDIDISDWLPRITAPTLALTGDRDPIVPPAQAQQIAGLVKGAESTVIAGAGHLPFAERATAYNAILAEWLAR